VAFRLDFVGFVGSGGFSSSAAATTQVDPERIKEISIKASKAAAKARTRKARERKTSH
jgi:hypothetical protein